MFRFSVGVVYNAVSNLFSEVLSRVPAMFVVFCAAFSFLPRGIYEGRTRIFFNLFFLNYKSAHPTHIITCDLPYAAP